MQFVALPRTTMCQIATTCIEGKVPAILRAKESESTESTAQRDGELYEVYDITECVNGLFRVKWEGFPDPRDDTWHEREYLIQGGFSEMVEEVDAYQAWKEDAEEGEIRTIRMYRKLLESHLELSTHVVTTYHLGDLETPPTLLCINH